LNFSLSPDFSVQLKVLLSERLSQKLKSPTVATDFRLYGLCSNNDSWPHPYSNAATYNRDAEGSDSVITKTISNFCQKCVICCHWAV